MLHLLQLEFLKWNKNLLFRILILLYIVGLPSILLLGKKVPDLPDPIGTTEVLFIFPTIFMYLAYIGMWLSYYLFGFLSVIIITTEYGNKTLRQNIITGVDREKYFLSKVVFVFAISLFATLYYCLTGLAIGALNTPTIYAVKVFQNFDFLPRYFLACFGYMTFGLFVAFLVKRTGLALILFFGYTTFGELILRWGLHGYFFRNTSLHYYPIKSFSDLIPFPFSQVADEFMEENGFDLFLSLNTATMLSILYIGIFLFLTYRFFRRADL